MKKRSEYNPRQVLSIALLPVVLILIVLIGLIEPPPDPVKQQELHDMATKSAREKCLSKETKKYCDNLRIELSDMMSDRSRDYWRVHVYEKGSGVEYSSFLISENSKGTRIDESSYTLIKGVDY